MGGSRFPDGRCAVPGAGRAPSRRTVGHGAPRPGRGLAALLRPPRRFAAPAAPEPCSAGAAPPSSVPFPDIVRVSLDEDLPAAPRTRLIGPRTPRGWTSRLPLPPLACPPALRSIGHSLYSAYFQAPAAAPSSSMSQRASSMCWRNRWASSWLSKSSRMRRPVIQ